MNWIRYRTLAIVTVAAFGSGWIFSRFSVTSVKSSSVQSGLSSGNVDGNGGNVNPNHSSLRSSDEITRALTSVSTVSDRYVRLGLLSEHFGRWFALDPSSALQYIRDNDPSGSGDITRIAIRAWAKTDFNSAVKFIKNNIRQREVAEQLLLASVEGLAEVSLASASSAVASLSGGTDRERAIEFLGRLYAERDVPGGLKWAMFELPVSRGQVRAVQALGTALAVTDPLGAITLARDQGAPDARIGMLKSALLRWGETNPHEAKAYLSSEVASQSNTYPILLSEMYKGWAKESPSEAAKDVAVIVNEPFAREAIATVASTWALRDPAAASDWAMNLPNDNIKRQALLQTLNQWLDNDIQSATRWIGTLPDPSLRDYASAITSSKLTFEFPDLSVQMANSLADSKLRRAALETILAKWQTLDQPTAKRLRESMQF